MAATSFAKVAFDWVWEGTGGQRDFEVHETSAEIVSVESTSRTIRIIPFGTDGRGVEALRPIVAGELIERSPVILVPEHDRVAVDTSNVGSYIFMWEHGTTGEDLYSQRGRAALVLGFTSLVNHSDDPNCTIVRYIDALAIDLLALRDIDAGEELRIDYHMRLWFTPL
jgi:SET domain-containing protein